MKIEYSISNDMFTANILWSKITCSLRDMLDEYGDNDDVLRLRYYDAEHVEDYDEDFKTICSCEMCLVRCKNGSDETRLLLVNLMKRKSSENWSIDIPIKKHTIVVWFESNKAVDPVTRCYIGLTDEHGEQIDADKCTDKIVNVALSMVVEICRSFFASLPQKKEED